MSTIAPANVQPVTTTAVVRGGLWRDSARRFAANRMALVGLIGVVLIVLVAIFAPWIALTPYDQANILATLRPPGPGHPLGTDAVGRDFYSRLVWGRARRCWSASPPPRCRC